jgi:hypothetical protein
MLSVLGRVPACAMSLAVARSGLLAGSTISVTKYADTVRHENPISAGCNPVGRIRIAFDDGLSSILVRADAARSTLPAMAGIRNGAVPHTTALRDACRSSLSTVRTDASVPTDAGLSAGVSAGMSTLPAAHSGLRADLCAAKRKRN